MLSAVNTISRFIRSCWLGTGLCLVFVFAFSIGSFFVGAGLARASTFSSYNLPPYTCTTGVGCCSAQNMPSLIHSMFSGTGLYAGQEDLQQSYYKQSLWPTAEKALKKLTDEARNSLLVTVGPRGSFIDAQTFNQTLTSIQKQTSRSVSNETASDQICRFGTLSRSLAQSNDRANIVQQGLATQMLRRQMLHEGISSAYEKDVGTKSGRTSDHRNRFEQYKTIYCDPNESNRGVPDSCKSTKDLRQNRDINVAQSLYAPLTLKLDFTETGLNTKTDDEEDLMALANNLFAHDLPISFGKADFNGISRESSKESDSRKERMMDLRALSAKRTVAQNSFAAIAAMKAEGSGASTAYVKEMLGYLGLNATDQTLFLGANPSYYAQMELLTRKIYQSPAFYANLMESNANVMRQQTAMEGIALMQDRDIYESLRRSEIVLSALLEMYIVKGQAVTKDKGTKE